MIEEIRYFLSSLTSPPPIYIQAFITSVSTVTYPSRYHYGAPDGKRLFTSEEPKMATQEIGKVFFSFFFLNEVGKGFVRKDLQCLVGTNIEIALGLEAKDNLNCHVEVRFRYQHLIPWICATFLGLKLNFFFP